MKCPNGCETILLNNGKHALECEKCKTAVFEPCMCDNDLGIHPMDPENCGADAIDPRIRHEIGPWDDWNNEDICGGNPNYRRIETEKGPMIAMFIKGG